MRQDARARFLAPGQAKVGVSWLMPMERFRLALEALGCRIVGEEPAPEHDLLVGPTLTIEGPFETVLQARWLVSDAKILAHRGSLDPSLTIAERGREVGAPVVL